MLLAEATGILGYLKAVTAAVYAFARGLGGPGLFLIALGDSSFLSVPEGSDILIVVLSIGQSWDRMLYFVAMTVLGSITGCSLLYLVGRRGGGFVERRLDPARVARMARQYEKWGVWAVMIPSILPPPTPFKVFVLTAGVFKLPFMKFLAAVSVGRTIRYLAWGVLAVFYGEWTVHFIHDNLPAAGVVLAAFLILSIVLLMVLRMKRRAQGSSPA